MMNQNQNQLKYKKLPNNLPKEKGLYIWRTKLGDNEVIFPAMMRHRTILEDPTLTPNFDAWTGFQILIPDIPLEWSEYNGEFGYDSNGGIPKELENKSVLRIVGKKLNNCPFCGEEPTVHYNYLSDIPQKSKSFEIKCCSWINSRTFNDLDELFNFWNEKIK